SVSEYVFPGEIRKTYMAWPSDALDKIQTATGLTFVTPHVLRHTFRTHAKLIGIPDSTVAEMLNHNKGNTITARYDHTGADLLRQPMENVAPPFQPLLVFPIPIPAADTADTQTAVERAVALAVTLGKDPTEARAFFAA